MFELIVQGDMASAHFLRGYAGRCKDLHGHTWTVEVTLLSPKLDEIGMVADFAEVKKQLKDFLMALDHVCLNDLPYFKEHNPTTENITKYICQDFAAIVQPLKIKQVRVWESDTSSVIYYE